MRCHTAHESAKDTKMIERSAYDLHADQQAHVKGTGGALYANSAAMLVCTPRH